MDQNFSISLMKKMSKKIFLEISWNVKENQKTQEIQQFFFKTKIPPVFEKHL